MMVPGPQNQVTTESRNKILVVGPLRHLPPPPISPGLVLIWHCKMDLILIPFCTPELQTSFKKLAIDIFFLQFVQPSYDYIQHCVYFKDVHVSDIHKYQLFSTFSSNEFCKLEITTGTVLQALLTQ